MKVTYARLSNHLKSLVLVKLGNPKAAAHVAVRPSVLHGHCKVLIIVIIWSLKHATIHAKGKQ